MRRAVLLSVAALGLYAAEGLAQAKPNFAGSWTMVADPNAPVAQAGGRGMGMGGGGLGQSATIAQDGNTLTVVRTTQMGEIRTVYNLDGSETKNTMMGRGGSMEAVSKARWEGEQLVVTTTMDMGGNSVATSMTLSLDASGKLVVQTTSPGRGGGEPVTRTATYQKN